MSITEKSTQNYSGFSPTLYPGCQLWLDAADNNTMVVSGTDVTQWIDKSGTGKVFIGVSGRFPQYTSNAINGLPSISFTGALSTNSQYMDTSGVFTANAVLTYFVVARQTVSNTAATRCIMKGSTSDNFILFFGSRYLTNGQYFATNSGNFTAWGDTGVNAAQVATLSNTLLMGAETSSSNGRISPFYNGRDQTAKTGIGSNYTGMRLGDLMTTGSSWGGLISEIIVYGGYSLLLSQRQEVERYLAQKWGLIANLTNTSFTLVHPYRYTPLASRPFTPLDVSGCELWLDAADIDTLNLSGTGVQQWNDKSGNFRHATRLAASNPTYNATGFNGYPTITFSTANCFTAPMPTNTFPAGAFIYAVWVRTGGNFETIINRAATGNGATPNPWTMTDGTTTSTRRRKGVNTGYYSYTPDVTLPTSLNNPRVTTIAINISPDAAAWYEYTNGTIYTYSSVASVGTPSYSDLTSSSVQIGNTIGLGTQFLGNICEIIVYRGTNNTDHISRRKIECYLANKWGLMSLFPTSYARVPNEFPRFNPINVLSSQLQSCDIWLDAADTTTITGTTTVTAWINKGRSSSNATGGTCSTGNLIGGMNYIRCPAGTNMSFTTALSTTTRSWFLVVRQLTTLTSGMILPFLNFDGSTAAQQRIQLTYTNATSNTLSIGTGSANLVAAVIPSSSTLNTVFMVSIVNGFLPASNAMSLNGTPQTLLTSSQATGYAGGNLVYRIGTGTSNAGFDVMEMMYFNGELMPRDRQRVEGYLAWRWGLQGRLPTTHPYKKFTP